MTPSLAEATAAARRIRDDFADPESAAPFEADALLLAGFVLAGDTERLRAALDSPCGCAETCGDDGDVDGPGVCKGLPRSHDPLVEIIVVRRDALAGGSP